MNPGDWVNCTPENIKIFETVYNPSTRQNVTGTFSFLTPGLDRVIISAAVMQNSDRNFASCIEINAEMMTVKNYSTGYWEGQGQGIFNFPANLSAASYKITKVFNSNITGPGSVQVISFTDGTLVEVGQTVTISNNRIKVDKKNLAFSLYSVVEMEAIK